MSRIVSVSSVGAIRNLVNEWQDVGETVALVPTMGNLHDGHVSLAQLAARAADRVVVSIYVNPTQFGPAEDFAAYPRTLDEDRARLDTVCQVDALFVPGETEIYPFGHDGMVRFTMPPLSRELCGASRPGHFDGVASVVCRLLNAVGPDVLVLGRKDYQQLVLIEYLVADLRLPVKVLSGGTVRDSDGLALSSRNRYLDADQRAAAPTLHAVLEGLAAEVGRGRTDFVPLQHRALDRLERAGFVPEYVEVRRRADLARPRPGDAPEDLIVVGAARLGRARLIDNTAC